MVIEDYRLRLVREESEERVYVKEYLPPSETMEEVAAEIPPEELPQEGFAAGSCGAARVKLAHGVPDLPHADFAEIQVRGKP